MENQHRKIKGYRELSQQEVDLMNRIKEKGAELLELQEELVEMLKLQDMDKATKIDLADPATEESVLAEMEFNRFHSAEPYRWANIGKTDVQTGVMALVRAVAQPAGV